ncbi:hypothetical protein CXG81DRAFT_28289 [Caulochytrium protostelioides]|uniref:Uncharacterized protein n=1 Tax=Caulochytrium protostelioides TaxID=1555241 RepID=A0A4P9X1S1_9FUNG|nr:hypothetical protein CXG81DRAFT_28289 [Caulochytrium protostelioides]|eukprot:RKO98923.1 hypothetical protein CXG81DRAFT_28289 [Caulochytrium protostelioides]
MLGTASEMSPLAGTPVLPSLDKSAVPPLADSDGVDMTTPLSMALLIATIDHARSDQARSSHPAAGAMAAATDAVPAATPTIPAAPSSAHHAGDPLPASLAARPNPASPSLSVRTAGLAHAPTPLTTTGDAALSAGHGGHFASLSHDSPGSPPPALATAHGLLHVAVPPADAAGAAAVPRAMAASPASSDHDSDADPAADAHTRRLSTSEALHHERDLQRRGSVASNLSRQSSPSLTAAHRAHPSRASAIDLDRDSDSHAPRGSRHAKHSSAADGRGSSFVDAAEADAVPPPQRAHSADPDARLRRVVHDAISPTDRGTRPAAAASQTHVNGGGDGDAAVAAVSEKPHGRSAAGPKLPAISVTFALAPGPTAAATEAEAESDAAHRVPSDEDDAGLMGLPVTRTATAGHDSITSSGASKSVWFGLRSPVRLWRSRTEEQLVGYKVPKTMSDSLTVVRRRAFLARWRSPHGGQQSRPATHGTPLPPPPASEGDSDSDGAPTPGSSSGGGGGTDGTPASATPPRGGGHASLSPDHAAAGGPLSAAHLATSWGGLPLFRRSPNASSVSLQPNVHSSPSAGPPVAEAASVREGYEIALREHLGIWPDDSPTDTHAPAEVADSSPTGAGAGSSGSGSSSAYHSGTGSLTGASPGGHGGSSQRGSSARRRRPAEAWAAWAGTEARTIVVRVATKAS